MKKVLTALLLLLSMAAFCAEDCSMEQLLLRARRSNPVATYAKLQGTLQHRRKGAELLTLPIYFGVILHPDRTVGQLILDRSEGYLLGQGKGSGVTSVTPMSKGGKDMLGYAGVRASDLTMSFLFCKPVKELEKETLAGTVPCRVLLLEDEKNKELIKVWIAEKQAFPLQAAFYRKGEEKPFRELEAGGFTCRNDLYFARKIRLEGPGWRTRIEFDPDSAEIGLLDPKNPPRIMMKVVKK